ncbi:MAG: LptF/LptG family permease [Chlamydiota bacterium]
MNLALRWIFCRYFLSWLSYSLCLVVFYMLVELLLAFPHTHASAPTTTAFAILAFRALEQSHLIAIIAFYLSLLTIAAQIESQQEWLPLAISGLTRKRFFFPSLLLACLLSLLCMVHEEYLQPYAHEQLCFWEKRPPSPNALYFEDASALLYATKSDQNIYRVYWIKNDQELWRMEQFDLQKRRGNFVDHFVKNAEGLFVKSGSWEQRSFHEMPLFTCGRGGLRTLCEEISSFGYPTKRSMRGAGATIAGGCFPLVASLLLFPFCARFEEKTSRRKAGRYGLVGGILLYFVQTALLTCIPLSESLWLTFSLIYLSSWGIGIGLYLRG